MYKVFFESDHKADDFMIYLLSKLIVLGARRLALWGKPLIAWLKGLRLYEVFHSTLIVGSRCLVIL